MRKFAISDIEAITGIKAHTIRIWEQRYRFIIPKRTETNIRYFDDKDLCLFLNISNLSEHGYKISEIARMTCDEMASAVAELSVDHRNNCIHVNAMIDAMLKFNERKFLGTLDFCIAEKGIIDAMIETVFPLMRKIGVMWQTGNINPPHEHFITNLIKRRLTTSIDQLELPFSGEARKFMLFLPEGETHEIGLLFANYLLRYKGHEVLYLGSSLPYEDLGCAVAVYKPDFCVSILTSVLIDNDINKVIEKLRDNLPYHKLILSGALARSPQIIPRPGVYVLKNIPDFLDFIDSPILTGA